MSLLLLALVALCAVPGAVVRGAVGYALGWVLGAATGVDQAAIGGAAAFASYPFVMALAAYADLPFARRRWLRLRRSRPPDQDEIGRVEAALDELNRRGAAMPARWAILGSDDDNSMVCGRTLLVGAGDVWSPHLLGILAHETGHLAGPVPDGRVMAAHNGFLSTWLPTPVQAAVVLHGRRRELRADAYAHEMGFGPELARMMAEDGGRTSRRERWWSLERSHPTHARRVRRLRRLAARVAR